MDISHRRQRWRLLLLLVVLTVSFIFIYQSKYSEKQIKIQEQIKRGKSAREIRDDAYLAYDDAIKNFYQVLPMKKKRRLPDLLGIGVEKCGTAAFRRMLLGHPMIKTTTVPEAHYFTRQSKMKLLKQYLAIMPEVYPHEIVVEETPCYFHCGADVPSRIKAELPNIKLYVILCDPVNRTFSDYKQEIVQKSIREDMTYDDVIASTFKTVDLPNNIDDNSMIKQIFSISQSVPLSHILTAGLYYYHLQRFYKYFNASDIFIIDGEELIRDPSSVYDKFQEFLGIPKLLIPNDFIRGPRGFSCVQPPRMITDKHGRRSVVNTKATCFRQGKGRTRLGKMDFAPSETIIKRLREFYAPYNEKLFKLLDRRMNWQ